MKKAILGIAVLAIAVVGLWVARRHPDAPPPATGYRPGAAASALPQAEVGGVRGVAVAPGSNPGHVAGSVPFAAGRTDLPRQTVIEIRDPSGRLVTQAHTNRDGSFNVDVPPGTYIINAAVPGQKHIATATVQVTSGQIGTVNFKLQRH